MDIKSKEKRSANMSKIRSKNTKPELFIRSLIHRNSYRYRVGYKKVAGKPDLYFTKKKIAIFVHGCFWHRHQGCKYSYTPKSNIKFWREKFEKNVLRDNVVKLQLKREGIRVLIIWECTIKRMMKDDISANDIILKITDFIEHSDETYLEI